MSGRNNRYLLFIVLKTGAKICVLTNLVSSEGGLSGFQTVLSLCNVSRIHLVSYTSTKVLIPSQTSPLLPPLNLTISQKIPFQITPFLRVINRTYELWLDKNIHCITKTTFILFLLCVFWYASFYSSQIYILDLYLHPPHRDRRRDF